MQGASLALHLQARRAIRVLAGACSEPAQRANETSGHVGNKIGTPLKTAVTDSGVDDNTRANAQSCACASPLATVCRPSSAPPGSDNFNALPPVSALSRLHWGLIVCRPRTWAQDSARPWRAGITLISSRWSVVKSCCAWLNCAVAQLNQAGDGLG